MSDLNFYDKINTIKTLTDYNDHTGAYILGAELLGANVLAEKFRLMEKMRDLENGMDSAMSDFQYALYQELMSNAKKQLSQDKYNTFYGSF